MTVESVNKTEGNTEVKHEENVETKVQVKHEIKPELKTEVTVEIKQENTEVKDEKLENKEDNTNQEKKENDDDTLPDLDMQLKIQDVRTLQPQEMNHEQNGNQQNVEEQQVQPLDLVVQSNGVKRKRTPTQSLPVDLSTSQNIDKVDLVYRKHNERFAPKKTLNLQSPVFLNPVLGKNVVDVSAMAHNIRLSWIQGKTQSRSNKINLTVTCIFSINKHL